MTTRRAVLTSLASAATGLHRTRAFADVYPSRPIVLVVPFPAGGPTDTVARVIAPRLSEYLAQPVVIENVTGAGGTLGAGRVARAAPDGYTLCVGFLGTHVLNGAVYALQYDVVNDFEHRCAFVAASRVTRQNDHIARKIARGLTRSQIQDTVGDDSDSHARSIGSEHGTRGTRPMSRVTFRRFATVSYVPSVRRP